MAGRESPHPQPEPPKQQDDSLPTYDEVSHGYEPLNNRPTGTNTNRFESLSEGVLGRRIITGVPPGGRFESDSAEGDDAGAAAAPPESAFSSFPGTTRNYASAIGMCKQYFTETARMLHFRL